MAPLRVSRSAVSFPAPVRFGGCKHGDAPPPDRHRWSRHEQAGAARRLSERAADGGRGGDPGRREGGRGGVPKRDPALPGGERAAQGAPARGRAAPAAAAR